MVYTAPFRMSVVLGLPKGFKSSPEVAMSSGVVSQVVRVQPNNISAISSGAQVLPTAQNTFSNSIPYPAQLAQFSIPAGQGPSSWIDTEKSTLSFRVNYQITTPGVAYDGASVFGYLQGGASSWVNRMVLLGPDGSTLDDVVNWNLAEHVRQLVEHNISDRDVFAGSQGFLAEAGSAFNVVQGHQISILSSTGATGITTAGNCFYSYEIPLSQSLIGSLAKGFFPIGMVNALTLQLYTPSVAPITFAVGTATATTAAQITITIDQIALNLFYLHLDAESVRMLGDVKTHYVHGITNRIASQTLAAGTSGYTNVLLGLRGKSCRQIWTRFSDQAAPALTTCVNGIYDSKMPLCTQLNYLINGQTRYPAYPHNTVMLPATVFSRTLMASERFKQWKQRSSFMPGNFFRYITTGTAPTAATGYDQNVVSAGSASAVGNLDTFVFGEDLRKCHNSEVLDGVDLSLTATHFLEMNVANAPTNANTVWFIGAFDIIYEIRDGVISYRM